MMCSLAASCQLIGRHGCILPRWARGLLAALLHWSYPSAPTQDPGIPMPGSLDLASLRQAYAEGAASPISVAREIGARIVRRGEDAVWISRVAEDTLLAAARALERRATAE